MKTVDEQIKKLYALQAEIDQLNSRTEALEKEKSGLLQEVAVEVCATKKKLTFPVPEVQKTLQISRRDYKKFTPDVDLLLENESRRYEDIIAPAKVDYKSNCDKIKRDAEKAKKVKLDIRYYLKVLDGIKEVSEDDGD